MDSEHIDAEASQSTSTLRDVVMHIDIPSSASQLSSPRSSALPSPPDSPDSTSSFPSLSSSFFLSSADTSPPHTALDHARDSTTGLIIPSLTLTDALRQPTPFGKTLAQLRIIVYGDSADFLLDDNDDVVHVAPPEATPIDGARLLRASTDWFEHSDAHGIDRFEPAHNIEILEISRNSARPNLADLAEQLLTLVHVPFREVLDLLGPNTSLSLPPLASKFVASSSSPLYSALVVLSSGLSTQERSLISALGEHIPVILIPSVAGSHTRKPLPLSSIRPSTPLALRTFLFRSPEVLSHLRGEASERFFSWHKGQLSRSVTSAPSWDKSSWEDECSAHMFSMRASSDRSKPAPCLPLDPLHIPSLFMFSLTLFEPTSVRLARMSLSGKRLGVTLLSTLCIGFGIGLGFGLSLRASSMDS